MEMRIQLLPLYKIFASYWFRCYLVFIYFGFINVFLMFGFVWFGFVSAICIIDTEL